MAERFPARTIVELLSDLASTGGRATLHFRSGRDLRGVVAQVVRGRNEETVVVVVANDATYVSASAIEAVTIHDVRPVAIEPPPTRLAARRAIEEQRRRIGAFLKIEELVIEAPIEETEAGEPLRSLVELSAEAVTAIEAAARDEMGRAALSRLRCVKIADGPSATVSLIPDGGILTFTAPLAEGARARLAAADLRAAVEALF